MGPCGCPLDHGSAPSVFDTCFGESTDNILLNPARLKVNPDARAYHSLSINLVSNLNQVFEWESRPDFTFSVYGTNLGGRAFFAEVSVAF